jgi:hypothetical protein
MEKCKTATFMEWCLWCRPWILIETVQIHMNLS